MITLHSYTFIAMILFSIGILGVISRRNIFVIYMSIELMLNAVNLILVAISRHYQNIDGQVMAMLVIAIAAAEAAVFLSIIVILYRRRKSLDSDIFNILRQRRPK